MKSKISHQSCCTPSGRKASIPQNVIHITKNGDGKGERNMIKLQGGHFLMGTDDRDGFPADGEGPIRDVELTPFFIDKYPVTNKQFRSFIEDTNFITESEKFGWSFVFKNHVSEKSFKEGLVQKVPGLDWWFGVEGASWNHPFGPDSDLTNIDNHPVVHISWNDAFAYCEWAGTSLPSEAQWEMAARGGLVGKTYVWGDELTPEGNHMCNIWQGDFPDNDLGEDGFKGTCPVDAFPANGFGIYSMAGNVWEWCNDWFSAQWQLPDKAETRINPIGPQTGTNRSMRGGSFLCHKSYCNRYRVAARTSNTPDSAASNLGFRCVRKYSS